jgi:hypothetical protein
MSLNPDTVVDAWLRLGGQTTKAVAARADRESR